MSGDYEHDVTGGLGRFDSFAAFAQAMQMLRGGGGGASQATAALQQPHGATLLMSESMRKAAEEVAAAAAASNVNSAASSAAAEAPGQDWGLLLFGLLLLLAFLHSFLFLAQRLWNMRMGALQQPGKLDKAGAAPSAAFFGSIANWFSFLAAPPSTLAPSASASITSQQQHQLQLQHAHMQMQQQQQQRAPIFFGMAVGIVSLLLAQWMVSPAVMHAMWGTRVSGGQPPMTAASSTLLSTSAAPQIASPASFPPCPVCPPTRACPPPVCPPRKCPACPAASDSNAVVAAVQNGANCPACYRLTDLPAVKPQLFMQSSWSALPVFEVPCKEFNQGGGSWVPRGGGFKAEDKSTWPAYTRVDQFMQYGSEPEAINLAYVYEPPTSCLIKSRDPTVVAATTEGVAMVSSFRRFDSQKFLRTLSGKTVAFLGDSLVRQQFGQLCAQLDAEKLGSSWFYPPNARFLDAVREVHFTHNVTLKNQWIMGHNSIHSARDEVFQSIWRSDVLVFNIGAFFHSDDPQEQQKYIDALTKFIDYTKRNYKGTVIWREYSPTHFDTPDGEFSMGAENLHGHGGESPPCKPYSPAAPEDESDPIRKSYYANYRLQIGNEMMSAAAIPIMRVWHHSLTQPQGDLQHPGRGDCRHWMSKSSIMEHWTDVLYNMIVPIEA